MQTFGGGGGGSPTVGAIGGPGVCILSLSSSPIATPVPFPLGLAAFIKGLVAFEGGAAATTVGLFLGTFVTIVEASQVSLNATAALLTAAAQQFAAGSDVNAAGAAAPAPTPAPVPAPPDVSPPLPPPPSPNLFSPPDDAPPQVSALPPPLEPLPLFPAPSQPPPVGPGGSAQAGPGGESPPSPPSSAARAGAEVGRAPVMFSVLLLLLLLTT